MNDQTQEILITTAKALMVNSKGLLAMDESTPTCNKRFAAYGISQTPESRRDYRELILTTPGLGEYLSGVILFDETVRQMTSSGESLISLAEAAGIIPGIKVDTGTVDLAGFPGEKITEGLDGLNERLTEYAALGLRFAKYRTVINIDNDIPTQECIDANMQGLARYAAICQNAGIVPIVEPEVIMDGAHSMNTCGLVTEKVLKSLFYHLYKQRVILEGIILKPNMVLAGLDSQEQPGIADVAMATVKCLLRCVPAATAGIAFLSGGQSPQQASAHLNRMNLEFKSSLPWPLTFSFSRAIQAPALEIWKGMDQNKTAAQQSLLYRTKCNSLARKGEYLEEMN
jgi:fructose-bisphosphate aldolase class I